MTKLGVTQPDLACASPDGTGGTVRGKGLAARGPRELSFVREEMHENQHGKMD